MEDISTGKGRCFYSPPEGEEMVSGLSTAGSQLSGADVTASQVGSMVLPPILLQSVAAKDGTVGAEVTAVCKSTRRVICTSDSEGSEGTFAKSCTTANKMLCSELLVPAKFCQSNDDVKGK